MDYIKIRKLLDDYNRNPSKYNDKEAETIALLARETGQRFKQESKPFSKALYQAGEMATFGLLPNSWEPRSRGQDVFGQTTIDKIASGAGMVGGLVGGGALAVKGAKGAYNMTRGMTQGKGRDAILKVRQKMSQAGVNIKDRVGSVAGAVRDGAAGRIASNLGQAGRLYGQGAMTTARAQGFRAADALSRRLGVPYETAVRILQYGGGGAAGLGALSMIGGDDYITKGYDNPNFSHTSYNPFKFKYNAR